MKELSKEEKKYFEDLKNLKPLPLDKILKSEDGCQKSESGGQKSEAGKIKIPKQLKEVRSMERLSNSKTLWGFGIAVFIYVIQNILIMLNVAGPDNLIMKSIIEAVIAIAGFFGVYGIRDALRKMNL